MSSKIDQVKANFAQPEQYLRSMAFNIQVRKEIVEGFVGDAVLKSILDIGCGNGAISIPLLRHYSQLTLLDISNTMLSIALSRIPTEFLGNVKTINEDFMKTDLQIQSYDLILCLGVLAHVDSPMDVIAKMVSLVKPNGSIIVENSDSQHPINYLLNLYSAIRNVFLPTPYPLNQLSGAKLVEMFGNQGLKLSALYRYSLPVPGMARVFSNDSMYNFIRKVYGTHTNNYRSWLGSECIYHFRKSDTTAHNH
jgi:2-polyprenyl-3-methyl-5-hydroxy-6-metoxy-1,4-benzoquinol methylase